MSEDFQWNDDYQVELLASRFEEMLHDGSPVYFDAEEFEVLIDYYQNAFNNEKSRMAVELAMQQHPYNPGLKVKLARQWATEGHFIKALELLNELEITEPNDAELIMTKGSVYSMMMEFGKAINEYKKALTLADSEDLEDIYATIAFEYENLSDFDHALEYLKKALQISKQPEQVLPEIGMVFEMLNDMDQAIAFFNQQIDINPYSTAAWFNLGLAFFHEELYEKAIDAFEYVLAIDDKHMMALINIGQCYEAMEAYEEAIDTYHEALTINQQDANIFYRLGECFEKQNRYTEALTHYQKATQIDEFMAEPWAGIGVIFDEEGNTKKAVKYMQRAIELDQFNTEFLLIKADMHIKLEEFSKAIDCFKKAEELDPNDPDLWVEYANVYVLQHQFEKASQILKTGLIHQPENNRIRYRLAALLFRQRSEIQGLFYLETALESDYDGRQEFLDFYPGALENVYIIDMINMYAPRN
jgi:tetratricopeptide (TPR) repeat protein